MGIAYTPLFTGFVYSQITLFKVRSVKRVWRMNAHVPALRVQKAEGCHSVIGEQTSPALELSSAGKNVQ